MTFQKCVYCEKYILFSEADHYYSHPGCAIKAKKDKKYPEDGIVTVIGIY